MIHFIAGTAGHIDHGKTALVGALTGIDTDRLAEEKRRGISIDLGFAHLDLGDDLRIGFVDVPGHERFVKNMLAGVGGVDLVLFVVAADESIKPQTREHFDICRLLGLRQGIVVLTKADLVDEDILGLVRLEVEEFVAGSFLEGAPIVAVSAATGRGLGQLRELLARLAAGVRAKDAAGSFRLPIDRAFSMRGFGTVVTGTMISGAVRADDEVELHPGGRLLRVRGLQVHGAPVERAVAGERTALNLSGVEVADLARGMTLAQPGRFRSSRQVDCRLELLLSARPLKHRAAVHFHAWTAETLAEVRLASGSGTLQPGGRSFARLLLREPLLVLPDDRFIIRMFSPVVTIGGGTVLDTAGPRRPASGRWAALADGSPAERVALLVAESDFGMSVPDLAARTGLPEGELETLAGSGAFFLTRSPQTWLHDRSRAEAAQQRLKVTLRDFHRRNPLAAGMAKEDLRTQTLAGAPAFLFDALVERAGGIVAEGESLRLASHTISFRGDEEAALERIEDAFRQAGLAVPATREVLAAAGVDPARARSLLDILARRGRLVRIGADLVYHASALETLRALLTPHRGERFAVPQFKEWTGVSRKYAIPLLEFLDRERVTRREGDLRLVL